LIFNKSLVGVLKYIGNLLTEQMQYERYLNLEIMMKKGLFFGSLLLVIFFFVECGSKVSQPKKYIIDVVTGPNGTVNPYGKFEALEGQSITFTFTPLNGIYITDLKVDGTATSLTIPLKYTLPNINANHKLDVAFNIGTLAKFLMAKQWVDDSAEIFQQTTQLWGTYENVDKPLLTFTSDGNLKIYYSGDQPGAQTPRHTVNESWTTDETINPATVSFSDYKFTLQILNEKFIKLNNIEPKTFNLIYYAK
jgi:hypothetical protein